MGIKTNVRLIIEMQARAEEKSKSTKAEKKEDRENLKNIIMLLIADTLNVNAERSQSAFKEHTVSGA
jgi:hypothetical protein